jgi:hypothetical protein
MTEPEQSEHKQHHDITLPNTRKNTKGVDFNSYSKRKDFLNLTKKDSGIVSYLKEDSFKR